MLLAFQRIVLVKSAEFVLIRLLMFFRKRLNVQYAMKMVRKLSMKIKSNTMNSKPELIIIFVESMDSKISFLFVRFKILFLQSIHQRFVCLMH